MKAIRVENKTTKKFMKAHIGLYLMLLPGLIYFLVFKFVPMLGIIICFQNYSPYLGFLKSPFVGLNNFRTLFIDPDFGMLLKNTLWISFLNLFFFFPIPILLSLILNEVQSQNFKRTVQTMVYIPHFISFVIVASLTYTLFNINDGIMFQVLQLITHQKIDMLADPKYFRTLIVGQNIWKESGYGTIIFLAALTSVDLQLYEAAKIDGAGRWRLMWHITLPAIRSTIIIMLILKVGSILNTGYEQIFLMRNDLNRDVAEVFDTYVYTKGIKEGQYSYSTTVGIFKSFVGMIFVLSANKIAKLFGESGLY